MRGWALYQRTQAATSREAAKREFEQALQIEPDSYEAKLGVAAVAGGGPGERGPAITRNRRKRRRDPVAELLARDPNRSQLHDTMALLRGSRNRLPESRFEWQRAIELDPNDAIAYGQLGVTLIYLASRRRRSRSRKSASGSTRTTPISALAYWSAWPRPPAAAISPRRSTG